MEELAIAKAFLSRHNVPDISRSARVILKDFVNGKLLYVYPPPDQTDTWAAEILTAERKGGRKGKKSAAPQGNSTAAMGDDSGMWSGEDSESEEDPEDRQPGMFSDEMLKADAVNSTLEEALLQNEVRMRMLQAVEDGHQ